VGDRGRQFPFGDVTNDHQIQVTPGCRLSLDKGPVQEGKLDALNRMQGFLEDSVAGDGFQDHALKVFVEGMSSVQAISDLVTDPFRLQEANGMKTPEVPEKISRRLVEKPLQFADMEGLVRMKDELHKQLRPCFGSQKGPEDRWGASSLRPAGACCYHIDNKRTVFDNKRQVGRYA